MTNLLDVKRLSLVLFFTALFPLSIQSVAAQPTEITIQSQLGKLTGLSNKGVNDFKGIPFATAKRFEMPVSALPWTGIKDATKFASNCPQAARFNLTEESLNEDCLYLNIATPSDLKPNEKLPVILWLPGGGFVGGGSNLYQLDQLARDGRMVIVSMNYRVGLFGFMPHPAMEAASNGDLGLEDQREAMRWVKKYIGAFGGDVNNITVAGESAGAGSICQHLASPEAVNGLFQKAFLISGACLQVLPTLKQALDAPIWKSVASNPKDPNRRFKCPVPGDPNYSDQASLACLKKISVSDLLQAQTFEAGNSILSFVPVTGNATVPRSFRDAVATGNVVKVPLMYGGAQNELRLYVGYDVLGNNANQTKYPVNLKNVNNYYLPAFYGSDDKINQKILTHYFSSSQDPKNLNGATLGSMLSDFNPHVGINNCFYLRTSNALNAVRGMPPIYQFEFADPNALVLGVGIAKGSDPGFPLGAVHSSILNYYFPNLSNTAAIDAPNLSAPSQTLGKQMTAYLASFMKGGKPVLEGQPTWDRYDGLKNNPSSNKVMFFSPGNIHLYSAYGGTQAGTKSGHQCTFWNEIFPE
jgi:para-nitrobenzyl esterase